MSPSLLFTRVVHARAFIDMVTQDRGQIKQNSASTDSLHFPVRAFMRIFSSMEKRQKQPHFSLIVTIGDQGASLERTLRSCNDQTFGDFEVLVAVHQQIDDVEALVTALDDPRIAIHRTEGLGMNASRNGALRQARGNYVLFLESPGEIQGMWLEKAAERLSRSHADAIQCATVYENDGLTGGVHMPLDALFGFHQRLLVDHIVPLGSLIVKRDICASFPEDKQAAGDWEFWIETLRGKRVEILGEYYGNIVPLQSDTAKKESEAYQRERYEVMRRYYPELRFSVRKVRQHLRIHALKRRLS